MEGEVGQMIRPATLNDLPALGRMMAAFHDAASVHVGGTFNPIVFEARCRQIINHRLGCALVYERNGVCGMLLAQAAQSPFQASLWADEIALWIDPGKRGGFGVFSLVRRYEAWARDLGATITGLSALDDETAAVLQRMGYAPAERKLVKVF